MEIRSAFDLATKTPHRRDEIVSTDPHLRMELGAQFAARNSLARTGVQNRCARWPFSCPMATIVML